MKYIKLSILALVIMMSACTKKVHISDIIINGDKTFFNDEAYTGEIWTDDDKSGMFNTKEGKLISLVFYHKNGKDAIQMTIDEKTNQPSTKLYDEQGKEIPFTIFQEKYMDILMKMIIIQKELQ